MTTRMMLTQKVICFGGCSFISSSFFLPFYTDLIKYIQYLGIVKLRFREPYDKASPFQFFPDAKGKMNLLLDPNVAYVILVVGFVLGVLALFTPGTGILEIGALFAIFLAGYAVYSLPINLWALILLVVGVIP